MNMLVNTEDFNGPLTMSSREIADLVEKRHDNVKRTIETLVERGVIASPQNEEKATAGRPVTIYHLRKRDTFVVVAQLSPEFTARVVDRWQQLEDALNWQANQPIDLNDPAQLVPLLTSYAQRTQIAEGKVVDMSPKAEAFDHLMNTDGLYGLQNAGRALGARPNLFTRWLKQDYLFYQGSALVPRIQFIQRGYFEVKTTIVEDKARPTTYLTPKGLDYLRDRLPHDVMIGGAA